MPVFATPKFAAAGPAADCSNQTVKTPETTKVFGCAVPARSKAVEAFQGQTATINWTMGDSGGKPVDLSSCGDFTDGDASTGEVILRIRETILIPGCSDTTFTITGSVTDVANGLVAFTLSSDVTARAGVYLCEATVYNTTGDVVFLNQFHLIINRSLTGGDPNQITGIPSIAEIRLHLRDSDPGENSLLDSVQFDLAELVFAIERPILYWNESQPPINQRYTTTTFPWRYYWLEGIVAELYIMAAHWYRRNRVQLQSQGGLGVDDLNKANEYETIGQKKREEFRDWVLRKKVQFNAEAAMQSSGSAYAWLGGYYGW